MGFGHCRGPWWVLFSRLWLVSHVVATFCTLGLSEDALEIERLAVEARRAIVRGRFEMTTTTEESSGTSGAAARDVEEFQVWFEGNKLRIDNLKTAGHDGSKWLDKLVVNGNQFIFHRRCVEGELIRLGVSIGDVANHRGLLDGRIFDPRVVGLSPFHKIGFLSGRSLTTLLLNPRRVGPGRVQRYQEGSEEGYVTEYELPWGTQVKVWIVPRMNYAVRRFESTTKNGETSISRHVEVALKEYQTADSCVWFPQTIRSTCIDRAGNKTIHTRENVEIRNADFRSPIDPAIFSMAALDIPPGTPVSYAVPLGATKFWDGTRLVDHPLGNVSETVPSQSGQQKGAGSRYGWLLWVGAVLLLTTGIAAMVAALRRLRR